jgi:hypothetical protein
LQLLDRACELTDFALELVKPHQQIRWRRLGEAGQSAAEHAAGEHGRHQCAQDDTGHSGSQDRYGMAS